jgi:hypothetical protein
MFWTVIVASLPFSVVALNVVVIVTRAVENRRLITRPKAGHFQNGRIEARQRGLRPGGTK